MSPIAADEIRHAELAWEVAAWAEPRLSPAGRRQVSAARARAMADLREEVSRPMPVPLADLAGLPSAESAALLVKNLAKEIEL
jgi:hypothetical protein